MKPKNAIDYNSDLLTVQCVAKLFEAIAFYFSYLHVNEFIDDHESTRAFLIESFLNIQSRNNTARHTHNKLLKQNYSIDFPNNRILDTQ